MARETRSHARVACEGPRPTGLGRLFGERRRTEHSPPYGVMGGGMHGEGNPLACACGMRGPSPYGVR